MQHLKTITTAWLVCLILAACTALPTLETNKQRLAMVDVNVTALANTIADLREGGLIPDDVEFTRMVKSIQAADTAVDAAWAALGKGDIDSMQGQIQLVNRLLWQIRGRLPKPGSTPP